MQSTVHYASLNISQCNAAMTTTTAQQTMADSDQCSSGLTSNVMLLKLKFLIEALLLTLAP